VDPHVVAPLYASGVAWTLLYDTVYAHQVPVPHAAVSKPYTLHPVASKHT